MDENYKTNARWPEYETLIDFLGQVPEPVCICNTEGRIVYVNAQMLELTGYDENEILSLFIQSLVPDYPLEGVKTVIWKSILLTKTEKSIEIEFHINSLLTSGGQVDVIRIPASVKNTGEFDYFTRSDELYRITINGLDDYVHLVDRNLRCLMYNSGTAKAAEHYSGIKTSLLGKTVFEIFPFLPPGVKEEYHQVLTTGKPLTTVECTPVKSELCWTETRKIPILNDRGETRTIISIVRDITELKKIEASLRSVLLTMEDRIKNAVKDLEATNLALNREIVEHKQTEEELAHSKASLEAQYNALPLPTYTVRLVDGHFVLVSYNNAALEDSRGAVERYKNCRIEEILKDAPDIIEDLFLCCREKSTLSREKTFHYPIRNEFRYLKFSYGYVTPDTVIIHTEDLTQRRKYENEMQKIHRLESLGILAGGIAHDFNNVLTGLMGFIELAGMSIGRTHPAFSLLEKAQKAALKSKNLTGQLLTFSKGGSPIRKPENIRDLIENSLEFILKGKPIECRLDIQNDLWLVEIDSSQMFQVINNLIINAVQAMPDGGCLEVQICNIENIPEDEIPIQPGRYVKIRIKDEGTGIPDDIRNKIFDPYFSTRPNGIGLGLAIAHSIIHKHDGYITFESKIGEGTTFDLYLPASKTTEISKEIPVEKLLRGEGRILVMDDEEIIRDVTKLMLEDLGYEVLLAKNGSELIEIYGESMRSGIPVYAILMDLVIRSGMGGLKTMEKLREIDPDVKVIVSSGYSNDPVMSNHAEYGFIDCATKPYEIREIAEKLHRIRK